MAAWKLLKHATSTRISVYTARNRLRGARLIFEFWNLILTPMCNFYEEQGIFSEYFVENVSICKKLNKFYVE